jgi:hypothetical protein
MAAANGRRLLECGARGRSGELRPFAYLPDRDQDGEWCGFAFVRYADDVRARGHAPHAGARVVAAATGYFARTFRVSFTPTNSGRDRAARRTCLDVTFRLPPTTDSTSVVPDALRRVTRGQHTRTDRLRADTPPPGSQGRPLASWFFLASSAPDGLLQQNLPHQPNTGESL